MLLGSKLVDALCVFKCVTVFLLLVCCLKSESYAQSVDIYNLIYDYSQEDYDKHYGIVRKKPMQKPTSKAYEKKDVKRLFDEKKIHIHFNGYTIHFTNDDPEINEFLYGAGISWDVYYFDSKDSIFDGTMIALEGDAFNDSLGQFAYSLGFSARKNIFSWMAAGVNVGVMNKQNVKADTGYPVFPFLFPFLQTTFNFPLNLRFTWIPPVRKKTDNQMTIQLMYSF